MRAEGQRKVRRKKRESFVLMLVPLSLTNLFTTVQENMTLSVRVSPVKCR